MRPFEGGCTPGVDRWPCTGSEKHEVDLYGPQFFQGNEHKGAADGDSCQPKRFNLRGNELAQQRVPTVSDHRRHNGSVTRDGPHTLSYKFSRRPAIFLRSNRVGRKFSRLREESGCDCCGAVIETRDECNSRENYTTSRDAERIVNNR